MHYFASEFFRQNTEATELYRLAVELYTYAGVCACACARGVNYVFWAFFFSTRTYIYYVNEHKRILGTCLLWLIVFATWTGVDGTVSLVRPKYGSNWRYYTAMGGLCTYMRIQKLFPIGDEKSKTELISTVGQIFNMAEGALDNWPITQTEIVKIRKTSPGLVSTESVDLRRSVIRNRMW